jgi:hypothetical protein
MRIVWWNSTRTVFPLSFSLSIQFESHSSPLQVPFAPEFTKYKKPVILRGTAVAHWNALERWKDPQYLIDKVGDVGLKVGVSHEKVSLIVCIFFFLFFSFCSIFFRRFSSEKVALAPSL